MKTAHHAKGHDTAAFRRYLGRQRREINRELRQRLALPKAAPRALVGAMRYSLMAGGKRVRPILVREACRAVGGADAWVLPACCALEMIHTYSLIHDDLPSMDDDRWRRGLPTAHVKFGEALAILSGDALHTLAFQILSQEPKGDRFAARRTRVLSEVAEAAGVVGMVGGQVRDLESEGRPVSPAVLARIHQGKTGALLTAAVVAGGVLGGGSERDVAALRRYGRWLGLAFQIVDDILDEEGTRSNLGKSPGKDRAKKKATYPVLFGLEKSRSMARSAVLSARKALLPLGPRSTRLAQMAEFILSRDS
ncbi:MAG: polyprenyl synthetase family protein [Acidobacteria bacterium]|nr:polyprenyl synthetase family protein [Acidobacteriota bacterium]